MMLKLMRRRDDGEEDEGEEDANSVQNLGYIHVYIYRMGHMRKIFLCKITLYVG